jgi:hypothetical protein
MSAKDIRNLMESLEQINEGTYWEDKGQYQKQAKQLGDLVPSSGPAKTHRGEIFRAASKIYYDYHNNGFGNVWPEVATFLMANVNLTPAVTDMLHDHAMGNIGHGVDREVEEMMNLVIEQIYKMKDKPNTTDMWDTPYAEHAFEPEQDEYDEYADDDAWDDDEEDDEDY